MMRSNRLAQYRQRALTLAHARHDPPAAPSSDSHLRQPVELARRVRRASQVGPGVEPREARTLPSRNFLVMRARGYWQRVLRPVFGRCARFCRSWFQKLSLGRRYAQFNLLERDDLVRDVIATLDSIAQRRLDPLSRVERDTIVEIAAIIRRCDAHSPLRSRLGVAGITAAARRACFD